MTCAISVTLIIGIRHVKHVLFAGAEKFYASVLSRPTAKDCRKLASFQSLELGNKLRE